jgi:hypothetical protein
MEVLLVVLLREPRAAAAASGEEDHGEDEAEGVPHSRTVAVR